MDTIIVAPHPDDEIIGCFDILMKQVNPFIVYTQHKIDVERQKEALTLKKYVNLKGQFFNHNIPTHLLTPDCVLYFPDPHFEFHPDHRLCGVLGESMARGGFNVIFYSVNMQAPYIRECKIPNEKEKLLNKVYPSQKDLWKYEKKYVLFEGYCKWIF